MKLLWGSLLIGAITSGILVEKSSTPTKNAANSRSKNLENSEILLDEFDNLNQTTNTIMIFY